VFFCCFPNERDIAAQVAGDLLLNTERVFIGVRVLQFRIDGGRRQLRAAKIG
jgi:hypothetical protein